MNSTGNFDFAMSLTGTLSSDKLGVTTTVKEQVDNIEVPHFLCRRPSTISSDASTSKRKCRASCSSTSKNWTKKHIKITTRC